MNPGQIMTGTSADANLRIYGSPEVAAYYASLEYLTPCERMLFENYIPQGSAILDLGVGGGRTTRYLAKQASRYVGVDYSVSMIEACRTKFPDLEFVVADAADLSVFPDAAFDVVIFAFNGIDYVLPEQSRRRCFGHIRRVLKVGGVVVFSSHNARAVLIRPRWNRERLQWIAQRFSGGSKALYGLFLTILTLARSALALVQAIGRTLQRVLERVPSRVFWRGEGNLIDSAHGGLLTHYWIPSRVIAELADLHLRPECIVGDDYPEPSHSCCTDWYYYVFRKPFEN